MTLDPQIAPLIATLDAGFPAGPHHDRRTGPGDDPLPVRANGPARARRRGARPDHPGARRRHPGADLPARRHRTLPVLVYAHGGGFVFCDLDSHDGLCREHRQSAFPPSWFRWLPAGARAPVAGGGRRRLRSHPVGGATTPSSSAATRAAIVVGGDSAGGNLAAVTALMARDRGGPTLAAQLLLYP